MPVRFLLRSLLLCAALATSVDAQGPGPLRPGDALKIAVWESPTMSGEFEVAPDGTLRHPLYNRITVAGVPIDSLRGVVTQFLRGFQREPLVNVEPLVRVIVAGEVRTPNAYLLGAGATIADALVKAGGIGDRGRANSVVVERGDRRLVLDLTRVDRRDAGVMVQSGDRITVERRSQWFTDIVGPLSAVIGAVTAIIIVTRLP